MPYLPDPRIRTLPWIADPVPPARFPQHILRYRNPHAADLGLQLDDAAWESHFARFEPLPGNLDRPLALRYHGHQFRHYNANLGDGRGFLFAQLRDSQGRLLDLGTKGSGTTPYSRGGDGRLTLKGGVREVLATEMLTALGVDTSQSFSLFETGEALYRGDEPSPTRSSVLVRLCHGHIRIGTFQRLWAYRLKSEMAELLEYAASNLLNVSPTPEAVFTEVSRRVATTAAQWMVAGFVHGVLNTDNINVTGESFDYGPWRFLPRFDPEFTAAYFDEGGLYAYGEQAGAVLWNLERLAECLAVVGLSPVDTRAAFEATYRQTLARGLIRRLGLTPRTDAEDAKLGQAVFDFLASSRVPFDRFFFDNVGGRAARPSGPFVSMYRSDAFDTLARAWAVYQPTDLAAHPYFQGDQPVSMVITTVEGIWDPIAREDDWAPFNALLGAIRGMPRW